MDVTLPSGRILTDVPSGTTQSEIAKRVPPEWLMTPEQMHAKTTTPPVVPPPASPGSELNLDSSGQPIPAGTDERMNSLMPAAVQQNISEQSLTPTRQNAAKLMNPGVEDASAQTNYRPEQPAPMPTPTGLLQTPAAQQEALMQAAARSGNVSPEFAAAVPGWNLEQQFGAGTVNSLTAGLAGRLNPALGAAIAAPAKTGWEEVARGSGDLVGFLTGPGLQAAKGTVALASGLEHIAGESFVKALAKDVAAQSATLGLATGISATGQALDANNPEDAAKILANASASGAGMGAIFGSFARILPDNTAAQIAARVIGVNATMDALNGTNPNDQRSLEKKLFDYGLNTVFSLSGAGRATGGWLADAASTKEQQAKVVDTINSEPDIDSAITAAHALMDEHGKSVAEQLQAIRPLTEAPNGPANVPMDTGISATSAAGRGDLGEGNANAGVQSAGTAANGIDINAANGIRSNVGGITEGGAIPVADTGLQNNPAVGTEAAKTTAELGGENALQEPSTSGVLQHAQEGTGEAGSERQRVEQGINGPEATKEGNGPAGSTKGTQINIGLATNDGKGITVDQVRGELDRLGISVLNSEVKQSGTEPTFVASLSRPMSADEAHEVSANLHQEAIAQKVDGIGELYGPQAENWKPFNPDYFIEPPKAGEVPTIVGTHFSQQHRDVLMGNKYGTGIKGAEWRRLENSEDPRIKQRISFYVDEGKGVFPEVSVGNARHDVPLHNLYDAAKNPLRLPRDPNDFESAVLDHGFDGYYVKEGFEKQGVAVLLGDAAKAVKTGAPEVSASKENHPEDMLGMVDQAAAREAAQQKGVEALRAMPSGMRKATNMMMERAAQGKRGGLVMGTEADNREQAATELAKLHGSSVEEESAKLDAALQKSKSPDVRILQSRGTKVNGFYHPELGTTFINADNVSAKDIPAVILHEVQHAADDPALNAEVMKRLKLTPSSAKEGVSKSVQDEAGNELMYSALTRHIENTQQKRGTPEQWMGIIKNAAGIKPEEVQWSGVEQWLKDQKGGVTKDDLLNYLRANEVQVKDVALGKNRLNTKEQNRLDQLGDIGYENLSTSEQEEFDALNDRALNYQESSRASKYDKYVQPGGKNYKELLLTMPERATKEPEFSKEGDEWVAKQNGIEIGRDTNLRGLREDLGLQPGAASKTHENFTSSHFDQKNILAHVRFDERTDASGNKTLHIAEVQSDWHQKGRREGYLTPDEHAAERKELLDKISDLQQQATAMRRRGEHDTGHENIDRYNSIVKEIGTIDDRLREIAAPKGVPNAPYKTTWNMLAMKRMIRYASEHGFDKITWDTGETQAARYDLSKQVDHIAVDKVFSNNESGVKFIVSAYDRADSSSPFIQKEVESERDIEDVIGKDAANKAILDMGSGTHGEVNNANLKLGGEGMKAFYDKMLVNDVNKYVKKFGGVVRDSTIGKNDLTPMKKPSWTEISDNKLPEKEIQVHELVITPAMKKAALEGQPMFSKESGPISGDIYARVLQRMQRAGETGNPKEATSYMVEEAMKMGQTAGHSKLDEGFWGWAQKALPQSVVSTLKRWVANIRAAMYKRGIMIKASDLKIDDFVAIAQSNMKELATGKREAAGGTTASSQNVIKQTDTPEFKRWFGNSKVVDAEGRPLVVYHGTNESFNEFDYGYDQAQYFTTDKNIASAYAIHGGRSEATDVNVLPVYLTIKNPLVLDQKTLDKLLVNEAGEVDWTGMEFVVERARLQGYDGLYLKGIKDFSGVVNGKRTEEVQDQWVTFEPVQIKSAIGNRGTFDPNNPSILASKNENEIPKEGTEEPPKGIPSWLGAARSKAADVISGITREIQLAVTPMAAGAEKYKAIAKDYANAERLSRSQWARFDDVLKKNYSKDELAKMWEAADEQNVLLQQGKSTAGKGLDRLTPEQRDTMNTLHNYGEALLQRAKDTGMFQGEGLPYWTPRMAVMIGDDGEYSLPKQTGMPSGSGEGRNITVSSQNLKQRKYLTTEETEAAMKAKLGEGATVVKDIRAMPMAMARLERAIAGRELINNIKQLGKNIGEELVSTNQQDGYFTIDHPAFKTYRPKMVEVDGKMVPAVDQNGDMMMERNPLYMRNDLKGPLKAIMSEPSGKVYLGLMALKGKVMSVVMYSPLIHNAVEYGRALPVLPGKMLTFQVYFEGNRAKHDPQIMREAITNGLVPIGGHGGVQDITGIMEGPTLQPGRSLTAKALGGAVGLVNKGAGEAVKRGIDYAGDVWHNKLLWDRVGDLQMGLYTNLKRIEAAKLEKSGMTPEAADGTAGKIAAHLANRYAGALPNEAMSAMSRKLANLTMFSRSFTVGNLGVMKDVFTGLPTDVQAQIKRDYGELALRAGVNVARRKAIGAFLIDIGLMYALNSVTQDAFDYLKRNKSLNDIEHDYADRLSRLWHKIQENPLSVINSPLDSMESLTTTAQNEPGKENRVLYGYDKNGTAIYVRMPMGKIGEEFIGWTTSPLDMLKRKESTFLRPVIQTFTNDRGFGRQVYNPDEPGVMGAVHAAGKIAMNFMSQQVPSEALQSLINTASDKGTEMDAYKIMGPLLGLTFSKGAPGGPAVGLMYKVDRDRRAKISDAMPEVRQELNAGNQEGAVQKMVDLGMTRHEIELVLRNAAEPSAKLSGSALRRFNAHADEESKAKMGQMLQH